MGTVEVTAKAAIQPTSAPSDAPEERTSQALSTVRPARTRLLLVVEQDEGGEIDSWAAAQIDRWKDKRSGHNNQGAGGTMVGWALLLGR